MPDQPQMNEPESRTPTGELKDQSQPPEQQQQNTNPEEKNPPEQKPEVKAETKPEQKPEAKTGAPEKYEDFKLPDGLELKPDTLTAAQELFKGLGLNQEQAQSLVDFHAAQLTAAAAAPVEDYNKMRNEWKTAAEADPDIGSFTGSKAKAIHENIGRALDALDNPKLKADFQHGMNITGIGDHPAFIKVLNALASQITEPRHVPGKGPSEHGQSPKGQNERPAPAQAMYPNLPA